uniref:Peptidase M13 C-terminal domain-containing protein n=1 Tax=Glossina brevipalpis TaxID=37001 RepID=A0A1A9W6K4_9MUSC
MFLQRVIILFILYVISSIHGSSLFNGKDPAYVNEILRLSKEYEIRNYLNESVNPCENFYQFACGNWIKLNPANTAEHIITGIFEKATEDADRKIIAVLDNDETAAADEATTQATETDKKIKNLYESCVEIDTIQDTYPQKLSAIISEFGEMPLLVKEWNEDDFDWITIVGEIFYKYDVGIIIGGQAMIDFNNNSRNMIYVGHGNFPLQSRSMYVDNTTALYRDFHRANIARDLEKFLGLERKLSQEAAKEIFNFEIELAKSLEDDRSAVRIDDMCTLTTVDEMNHKYAPELDIKRLLNISFGHPIVGEVYEVVEGYQKNLIEVLRKTPKRVVANYIFYTLMNEFTLRKADTVQKQKNRCVSYVKKLFADVLDNMVYRKYIKNHTELDVYHIWQELKATFKRILLSPRLNWIQKQTLVYAAEKMEAMQLEISSYSDKNFTGEYADLTINRHDYVNNLKHIKSFFAQRDRKKMYEPPETLDVGEIISYTPVNLLLENKIKIPVALLQPYYLWASVYPNALKFGTIGTLIGHEIIHGFDDMGRMMDKYGNSKIWWDSKSTEAFNERVKCFINQYHQYKYGGITLPEMPKQSENIADNGGIRIAYEAYLDWYRRSATNSTVVQQEKFNHLNYSNEQLFFISYAQLWCSDAHPAVLNMQSSDIHVPNKYRVIGSLSNFEEFSNAFNCPIGSSMNPEKKCVIY